MKENYHISISLNQRSTDVLVNRKNLMANMGFQCLMFRENPDAS